MSSTRLLVLGVVRFAQPVHGYDVRRELISWEIEDVTNVKPGSIYSALRTLERDGLIVAVGQERADGRPERTAYELTGEGEKEFQLLLRKAWWNVDNATEPLVPALTMLEEMPRKELIAAVDSRVEQLRGRVRQLDFILATIKPDGNPSQGEIPDHAREVMLFVQARFNAEIEWAAGFRQRVAGGRYTMADDDGAPQFGAGRGWPAIHAAQID